MTFDPSRFDAPNPDGAPDPAPLPKAPAPGLDGRAPRPVAVRLRRGVVIGLGLAAAALCGAPLVWSFVLHPRLQMAQREAAAQAPKRNPPGAARPSKAITDHPADYGQLAEAQKIDDGPKPEGEASSAAAHGAPIRNRSSEPPARQSRSSAAQPSVRDEARRSDLFFKVATSTAQAPSLISAPQSAGASRQVQGGLVAPASPYELKAGTVLPGVLLTEIDTARPGPVVAMLSEDLFDTVEGRHLLAPQGSRLIGRHDGASRYGDRRAFITWSRLILPNGKSASLSDEPGVDARGAIGAPGHADRRLGPLALATLFAGAITTLGQAARDHSGQDHSLVGDAGDAAAIDAAKVGGRLVEREMDVAPSIRLSAGARVQVLLTHDLALEPYAQ